MDPLNPNPSLLAKLGSLIVHHQEKASDGHPFDQDAIKTLEEDTDVVEWFAEMERIALIPKKRN